jgi:hypothetical protein
MATLELTTIGGANRIGAVQMYGSLHGATPEEVIAIKGG